MVNVVESDNCDGLNSSATSPTALPNGIVGFPTDKLNHINIDGRNSENKKFQEITPNGDLLIGDQTKKENNFIGLKEGGKNGDATKFSDIELTEKLTSEIPPKISVTMKNSNISNTSVAFSEESSKGSKDGKKPEKIEPKKVGFFELFRFSSRLDKLMMLCGTLGAIGAGCTIPLNFIIYGNVAVAFIQGSSPNITYTDPKNTTLDTLFENVSSYSLQFCAVGIAIWFAMYIGVSMWTMAAESQMLHIRHLFFQSVLRQEIAWFDTHDSGELGPRMADDLLKIGDAMGDKIAMFIQWITVFLAGYAMALIQGWKLALAVMSISPLLIFIAALVGKVLRFYAQKELRAYAKAGSVAEEVLSSIRTVAAFHGQDKEAERYSNNLHEARRLAIRKSVIFGIGSGSFWVIIFCGFAIAFIYGMMLSQSREIHPGTILQVFFGVLMGALSLGHAVPNLESFALARAAAAAIFDIIDRDSAIDSFSDSGEKPIKVEGNVEFQSVYFNYPSRPDVQVLTGFNMEVSVGTTVALVGSSGCGKSTTGQLLQRFYDPIKGQVLLDGRDIKQLNVGWLRRQIGVVSQEPVLFATTIADNIRYGRMEVTQQEVEAAAREANAHDFIMDLPLKYETEVGERGAQLSGGQKQRIAIARALISNPKILLLDEATSALDTESESIVQDALEKAQYGRTTLVIAHRLSTIINADKIVAIKDGVITEQGTHAQLMKQQGFYYSLYQASSKAEPRPDDDSSATEDECDEERSKLLTPKLARLDSHLGGGSRVSLRRDISGLSEHRLEDAEVEAVQPFQFGRLIRLNSPEWLFISVGSVAAIIVGGINPMFAIVFSELLKVFTNPDPEEQLKQTYFLGGMIILVGVAMCLFKTLQGSCFGVSGANLTLRVRNMAFRSMLRQDMGWYDSPNHQVGSLATLLSNDAALVEGATGSKIGTFMESMASIVVAMVIAFYFGWKLAFVVVAFFPVMIFSGIVQGKMLLGFAKGDRTAQNDAAKISLEAIDNIRTVASLTLERHVLTRYSVIFKQVYRKSLKRAQFYGLTYGFTQSVMYFAYAAAFTFGARLVQQGEMEFFNVFRVFAAIIFTGMSIGRSNSFAPDFSKAKIAAGKLFDLFDREPVINIDSKDGKTLSDFSGQLVLRELKFRYPTRPDVRVLRGLDLEVNPGETVALVGSSGCGKSTIVQLVERFYDPAQGDVLYDGIEGRSLNINWLRSQIGIVSQEPVLFDRSIKENIAYGDNSRDVPMAEIIDSSRAANIHNFIQSLPMGYDTPAGDKGGQLSGGQKQRVAIARALIRNPKILLLDEATSALDSESQRAVQEALDVAGSGRTCIVIAHRLSTIETADRIAVIHQGRVVELGTHQQLMARKSHYYNLNNTHILAQRRKSKANLTSSL